MRNPAPVYCIPTNTPLNHDISPLIPLETERPGLRSPGELGKSQARNVTGSEVRNPALVHDVPVIPLVSSCEPQTSSLPGKLGKSNVRQTTEATGRNPASGNTTKSFTIQGYISGAPVSVLIDSGSDLDCISEFLATRLKLPTQPHKAVSVQGANGAQFCVVNQAVRVPLQLHTTLTQQDTTLLVTKICHDIILGTPWMRMHRAQFDYDRNSLTVGNQHIPFVEPVSTPSLVNECTPREFVRTIRSEDAKVYLIFSNAVTETTSEEVSPEIQQIMHEFKDCFPTTPIIGLPPSRPEDHHIDLLPNAVPWARSPYRLAPPELEELRRQITHLIKIGHIQPSISPWGAPILFVKKKDGTLRMCIDYRALNKMTALNSYPLPHIEDLLDKLQGAKYYTKLDLDMAYHQMRIHPPDIPKTAFNCPLGHFEFKVLAFGLTNAPATFQTLMNRVLQPYLDKFVIVYLDDILIFSKDFQSHLTHIRQVLQALHENELYAKPKKCSFGQTQIGYLSHIVDCNGVQTDPAKVIVVQEWATPWNSHDIRSFLGLTNYY